MNKRAQEIHDVCMRPTDMIENVLTKGIRETENVKTTAALHHK